MLRIWVFSSILYVWTSENLATKLNSCICFSMSEWSPRHNVLPLLLLQYSKEIFLLLKCLEGLYHPETLNLSVMCTVLWTKNNGGHKQCCFKELSTCSVETIRLLGVWDVVKLNNGPCVICVTSPAKIKLCFVRHILHPFIFTRTYFRMNRV